MKWKRILPIAGIVIGCLLTFAPIVGALRSLLGINRAFEALGHSGVGDPAKVSASIGTTLNSAALGVAVFPIGTLLLVISIVYLVKQNRPLPPPPPADPSII
jgi:hypothetical protein